MYMYTRHLVHSISSSCIIESLCVKILLILQREKTVICRIKCLLKHWLSIVGVPWQMYFPYQSLGLKSFIFLSLHCLFLCILLSALFFVGRYINAFIIIIIIFIIIKELLRLSLSGILERFSSMVFKHSSNFINLQHFNRFHRAHHCGTTWLSLNKIKRKLTKATNEIFTI